MKSLLGLLGVAMALLCATTYDHTYADDRPGQPPAQLQALQLVSGPASIYAPDARAATVSQLPADCAFIAQSVLSHQPKASFAIQKGTLYIGLTAPGVKDGEPLASLKVVSDCPDNSQFDTSFEPALAEQKSPLIQDALIAWTRYRHNDLQAPLRQSRYVGELIDVQLKLTLVSQR